MAGAHAQEAAPAGAAQAQPDADASAGHPGFFFWQDTSLSLLPYGDGFEVDPSQQSTVTLEYAHESKIGDLFLFVDFTKFHDTDGDDTT